MTGTSQHVRCVPLTNNQTTNNTATLRRCHWHGQCPAAPRDAGSWPATAAAMAAPWIVPASALGRGGQLPPSERITIGMLGVGNRGSHSLRAMQPLPDHQVVAIADPAPRPRRVGPATGERILCPAAGFRAVPRLRHLQRFPRAGGARRHRRRVGLRARPLARRGLQPRDCRRQGPLRREADYALDQPGHPHPRCRCGGTAACSRPARSSAARPISGTRANWRSPVTWAKCIPSASAHRVGRSIRPSRPRTHRAGFDYDMWTGPAPFIPFDTKRCEWLAMYMISHYCAGFITNWGVHYLDIAGWGCPGSV